MINLKNLLYLSTTLLLLNGCAVTPKDLDHGQQDNGHHFYRTVEDDDKLSSYKQPIDISDTSSASPHLSPIPFINEQIIVRGDILSIKIGGLEEFSGLHQITKENTLELPFTHAISTQGLTRAKLIAKLKAELVRLNWFYEDHVYLDLSIVHFASINVAVTGSVFNPGRVSINNKPALKQKEQIQQYSGAFSSGRSLTAALQAAGGVRPDADLNGIYLKRGSTVIKLSLTNILNGDRFVETPSLIDGDEIIVASTLTEEINLIRPSQITPPGMRILMSNLTAPALNNAQSAVGSDSTRLPYGSSLLDSAVSANCIGGTHYANASRSIILITRNYGSKKQLVIKRSINQLLANSSDHNVNPYLMPNDGVACYDSRFTNFRDVARGIGELFGPIVLGGLL